MVSPRLRHPRRAARLVPTLLMMLAGTAWLSPVRAANVIRYVLPVIAPGKPLAYDVYLDSSTEFPMRDEVIYLSIGGRQFLNSHYVQGGTLHTIVFRLTQSDYQSVQEGAHTVVYYGQDDAANSSSQWDFGKFHKQAVTLPVLPIKPQPVSPIKALVSAPTAQRGQK